jgi:hypothetical protein
MGNADLVYRRTASSVVLLLSLMLGFEAANPFSSASSIVRIILFVVVVLLIVGILPRSYLQERIRVASQAEPVKRSRVLKLVALIAPILLAALAGLMVAYGYDTLSLVDNTNIGTIDRNEAEFNLIRFWALGEASILWLVLIAAALSQRRTQDP